MAQRIDGVVLLDKPNGMSSQSAVTAVKRHFQAEKAGHTGTLDPMATGLLPICLGEATKYSQDLLDADKTYIATVRFGIETDTGDAEGQVLSERSTAEVVDNLMAKTLLEAILPKFIGEIDNATGITAGLASAIVAVANNLDIVAVAAVAAAGAVGGWWCEDRLPRSGLVQPTAHRHARAKFPDLLLHQQTP